MVMKLTSWQQNYKNLMEVTRIVVFFAICCFIEYTEIFFRNVGNLKELHYICTEKDNDN